MKIVALLAIGLAGLTFRQEAVWRSNDTLWAAARLEAPLAPRPLVNLAAGRMAQGDVGGAQALLRQAWGLSARQSPFERDWTRAEVCRRMPGWSACAR
jgi:hypothetical protein